MWLHFVCSFHFSFVYIYFAYHIRSHSTHHWHRLNIKYVVYLRCKNQKDEKNQIVLKIIMLFCVKWCGPAANIIFQFLFLGLGPNVANIHAIGLLYHHQMWRIAYTIFIFAMNYRTHDVNLTGLRYQMQTHWQWEDVVFACDINMCAIAHSRKTLKYQNIFFHLHRAFCAHKTWSEHLTRTNNSMEICMFVRL